MIRAARRATAEELTTAKRIHTDPDRRETPRAAAAFDAFCRLGPGRTLTKLHQQFLAQREQHRQNPTATPLPPTCYLETIREWSAVFHWAARVAIWDAELQAARQAEMRHQIEAQAREDAQLLHSVGAGSLAAAAVLLNDLIDAKTGLPKRPASPRDIQPLARAGIECLSAAGASPEGGSGDANAGLRAVLDSAPDDVRSQILRGLHALANWCDSQQGRR